MKTRSGFVSNSSSTSFVVAVPKNIELTDDDFATVRQSLKYYQEDDLGAVIGSLPGALKKLIKDGQVYEYADGWGVVGLEAVLKARGLVLTEFNGGPEDGAG